MDSAITINWVLSILQVVWLDVLLSGDNAIVIALVCQTLPVRQRPLGLTLGVGLAIVARLLLALVVSWVLLFPGIKMAGGLTLAYIAVKTVLGDDSGDHALRPMVSLWRAICLIALADVTMSLDNVVAVAAAAHGRAEVFALGLLISIPCTVVGASLISGIMTRFPLITWTGGALLGWLAGDLVATDPLVRDWLPVTVTSVVMSITVISVVAAIKWRWRCSNVIRADVAERAAVKS